MARQSAEFDASGHNDLQNDLIGQRHIGRPYKPEAQASESLTVLHNNNFPHVPSPRRGEGRVRGKRKR